MKRMMITLLMGTLALAGCSTMTAGDKIEVEIHSSRDVKITHVTVREKLGTMTVRGSLRPMTSTVARSGHVDVDFLGKNGTVIKTARATPHISTFSRKSARRPTFSVSVEVRDVSAVQLTHHADTMNACEL